MTVGQNVVCPNKAAQYNCIVQLSPDSPSLGRSVWLVRLAWERGGHTIQYVIMIVVYHSKAPPGSDIANGMQNIQSSMNSDIPSRLTLRAKYKVLQLNTKQI